MSMHRVLTLAALLWLPRPLSAAAHGDLHEQIAQLSAALRETPASAELWHKRGELYRAHHDYAHALADYAHAERLDPELSVVRLSRGRALYEAGKLRPALQALDAFLVGAPTHGEALLLRARVEARLGARAAAERDFAAALQHSADPLPDLFLERAQNLDRAGQHDQALAALAEAEARLGPLVTLDEAALALELRLARYPAALLRIDAMLARSGSRNEHLLLKQAEVLEKAGQREVAQAVRRKALAQLEALPEAKRQLASNRDLVSALERGLRPARGAAATAAPAPPQPN